MSVSSSTYNKAIKLIQHLSSSDQLRLLENLAGMVRSEKKAKVNHSILEIRGLGKEIWREIDVEKYINKERSSWDG